MNIDTFFIVLIIGVLMLIVIAYLCFVDFVSLLLKIMPISKIKGYNNYKKTIDSSQYKKHKNMWRKIYLLDTLIYASVFTLISLMTQNLFISFLLGLIASIIAMIFISNKERTQRKIIEKEFLDAKTDPKD